MKEEQIRREKQDEGLKDCILHVALISIFGFTLIDHNSSGLF